MTFVLSVCGVAALMVASWAAIYRITRLGNARADVLELLCHGELYGHEIVMSVTLSRASVYVLLDRMEEAGQIESRPEPNYNNPLIALGGVPRRLYRLSGTPVGKR